MGGIGKTTLARVVYDQMSPHFEAKSFIADVREVSDKCGLVSLQKQLLSETLFDEGFEFFNVHEGKAVISNRLSRKKVLVVLDDVDNRKHLEYLVGRRDWFGLGSRIIVTTRDDHLLQAHRVDDVYKPSALNNSDALRLFNSKAFDGDRTPKGDFIELSAHVVGYASGLPLALEVLGSILCGRDAAQWRSAIERLERDSNKEIIDRLRISFDGLEEREKNIFLDIACFFNGEEKDFVMKVLDGCEFFPDIGIDVLATKSLVTVDGHNRLWMHDLLKEMGRKIVRDKSINEPGKRCSNLISLPSSIGGCKRLKTLNLSGCYKIGNLPESLQQAELLEELDLSETAITEPPSFIFEMKNLKVLSFNGCKGPSSKLRHVLPSLFFGRANSMALMLPSLSGLSSLTELKLKNCNLGEGDIPSDVSCLASLETLDLSGNNFISIPSSFTQLPKLQYLELSNCRHLKSLPELLTGVTSVSISGCASLELIANPSKVCNPRERVFCNGIHCYKLAEKMNVLTLLKKHLKVFANARKTFGIILPGNEIPEWFNHKSVGSFVKIRLPLNIQYDSQWMGVALCCIFVNRDASRDEDPTQNVFINNRNFVSYYFPFIKRHNQQPIKRDHLLLNYFSRDRLWRYLFDDKRGEFKLSFENVDKSVYVKQCGVRIVYQEDLEDIRPIEEQYNNQGSAEFDDIDQDRPIANASLAKRKRNASEEDIEPEPLPKRKSN